MKLVKYLFSAFITPCLIFSFVGSEIAIASDVDNALKFQGRVRGWYESSSKKENSDADTISETKFQASSRIGVCGKTVKGDWTAKVKLEIEAHEQKTPGDVSTTARDASITIGNKSFDVKLGRQWMPDFAGNNTYSAMNSAEETVGGLGRTEGAVLTIKSLPNATVKFTYNDVVDENDNDVTAYQPLISYNVNDKLTIGANYTSYSKVENEDKGGDSDNSETKGGFALFAIMNMEKLAPYLGYENLGITKSSAEADDEDSSLTKLLAGVDLKLAKDMGLYAEYFATTESPDEGDDVVTTNISLALEKTIAHTELQLGYNSETVDAGDDKSQDGAACSSIVAGLRYKF